MLWQYSDENPLTGTWNARGIKKSRFSTNISLYLRNDTRYGHSYYGKRIGSRIQAFEWYHFQWPWTTRNSGFNVTPLFDVEYLGNSMRSIVSMELLKKTEGCHFEWHWVIVSDLVKYLMTQSIARLSATAEKMRISWCGGGRGGLQQKSPAFLQFSSYATESPSFDARQ